jgi:hypothetical protein
MRVTLSLLASLLSVAAQDPAQGWLGYAVANCPAGTTLTLMDAYWPVGATPKRSQSFYSPWFGIDASDNLNLLQPVNPWMVRHACFAKRRIHIISHFSHPFLLIIILFN